MSGASFGAEFGSGLRGRPLWQREVIGPIEGGLVPFIIPLIVIIELIELPVVLHWARR